MSKIIFYTKDLEESVKSFMEEIQSDEDKARRFITYDQMSQRTKITLDSLTNDIVPSVVSSIVTFATLVNDIFIFVPWMSMIRGSMKEYIEIHNIDDIEYRMLTTEESKSDITILSGERPESVMVIPDGKIEYSLFVPTLKQVLYLLPVEKVESILKTATQYSKIEFTNADKIRDICKFTSNTDLAIALPELQIATWQEMNKFIQSIIQTNSVDAIYCESTSDEYELDFFMSSIISLTNGTVPVYYGDRAFEIVEAEPETTDEVPTVDVEVVSE